MTKYLTLSKYSVLVIIWAVISKSVVGLLVRRWPDITGILQAAVRLYDPLASLRLHIAKALAWLCSLSSTDNAEQSWKYYRNKRGRSGSL